MQPLLSSCQRYVSSLTLSTLVHLLKLNYLCCLESSFFAGPRFKRNWGNVGKLLIKQCMVFNEAFPTIKDISTWVNYKTNIRSELFSEVCFCLPDTMVCPIFTLLSFLCQAAAGDRSFVLISQWKINQWWCNWVWSMCISFVVLG